jgi:hypothetical protein
MRRLFALCALPLPLTLLACTYGDGHHRDPYGTGGSAGATGYDPLSSTIDRDSPVPGYSGGEGAGVFVDYTSGGRWDISLACDTLQSGSDCNWDVIATPVSGAVTEFGAISSDADDLLGSDGYYGVRVNTLTGYEIDHFYLVTTAGMALSVDALLDGYTAERYIYWMGNGGLHRGAPQNPIELVPSGP